MSGEYWHMPPDVKLPTKMTSVIGTLIPMSVLG
jgi:hypothetical protein